MTQPINSGAPQPVQGVTGGPGINQGTASVDPGTGALVFHPQPANVVQVRGSTPGAFQVYEYFHTNTDFARLSLNAQVGGPFQLAVETQPPTVHRGLQIIPAPITAFEAVGIVNNITATAPTVFTTITDMSLAFTTPAISTLLCWYSMSWFASVVGADVQFRLLLDGATTLSNLVVASMNARWQGLSYMGSAMNVGVGSHTIVAQWSVGSGDLSGNGIMRTLRVLELLT